MENQTPNFEELPLARANVQLSLVSQYRIYSDHKNFKLVQADSAVTALEQSGMKTVYKIEREALHKNTLLTPNYATPTTDAEGTA